MKLQLICQNMINYYGVKKKVKELFKYETKKPRWIQQPEWPIIDNRPLIFKYQKTSSEGVEQYFFYDSYTGETRIIEQVE